MKKFNQFVLAIIPVAFMACCCPAKKDASSANKLNGSWQLVSSQKIIKGDTTTTTPKEGQEMIKIFNDTDFAFFTHDLKHGKDSATAVYSSGSGTYTLKNDKYHEHLVYCTYREWENHDFDFTLQLKKDTLIQTGIEKIDSLKIDQQIIETYVRKR
jgi:hypothetical protein